MSAVQQRQYQIELASKILNAISTASGKNTVLAVLPTGAGKTVVAGGIVQRCIGNAGYRCLTLAHRNELITQAKSKFYNQYGIQSGIIKSGVKPNYRFYSQVGSVQSYVGRIGKIPFKPKVIIIDEAHHCTASTYRNILKAYPGAKVIGFTATPYRLDGQGFTDIFESMVEVVTVKELEDMGFLCPADIFTYPLDKDNILRELAEAQKREKEFARREGRKERVVKLIDKGDYDENIIGNAMSDYQVLADMLESYKQEAKGRATICFSSTVAQSKLIVDYFNEHGVRSAHVDAKTENRDRIFLALERGELDFVSNVAVLTEGFDSPIIECVMLARKTKSLALYWQMAGRGSRLYTRTDGTVKKKYTLLDFCDNFEEHGYLNKQINWNEHFEGSYKKGKAKNKSDEKDVRYEMELKDGSIIVSTIADIPKGIKGIRLVRVAEIPEEMEKMPFQELFLKLSEFAATEQHKPMSAYVKWQAAVSKRIKKGIIPSISDFVFVANRFGYSEYWAQTQMKNLFQQIQSTHEKNLNLNRAACKQRRQSK